MSIWKKVKFFVLSQLHHFSLLLMTVSLFLASVMSMESVWVNVAVSASILVWMLMMIFYPASDFYSRVIREHERELGLYDHESAVKVI